MAGSQPRTWSDQLALYGSGDCRVCSGTGSGWNRAVGIVPRGPIGVPGDAGKSGAAVYAGVLSGSDCTGLGGVCKAKETGGLSAASWVQNHLAVFCIYPLTSP